MGIKVFTISNCIYCEKLKDALKEENIKFNEINCDDNPEIMGGYPTMEIGSKRIIGLPPHEILMREVKNDSEMP